MPIVKWGHETKIVPVEWCWKPMIPYGKITIIEGDGGDGKTTMILTIAAMLSQGIAPPTLERGHLLPSATTEPITTFYLTTEDEVADTSLVRFIRAGGDTHRFAYSAEIKHHMTLVEDELLAAIEESKCRLFIIDPYQAFLPEGTNMGSVTKMRTVFTTLSNIAKKTGVAIVLVGHLNKNEGGKDIHRGFGSADIAAAVRSILMVEIDKKNRDRRLVRTIKSNFDDSDYTPIQLVLDDERKLSFEEFEDDDEVALSAYPAQHSEHLPYSTYPVSPKMKTKIELAQEIISDILLNGPHTVAEINEACAKEGIGEKTAQRARKNIGAVQDYINGVPVWKFK
ncbi:MAG: AAA family ATPase [Synergistaceae bacterium]|nr:AAA family ATPase [Synergistaceae bacterium]